MDTNVLCYVDNLDILRRYLPDAAVDLVYLDPPFNSNRDNKVIFREQSENATQGDPARGGVTPQSSSWALGFVFVIVAILAGSCSSSYQPSAPPTLAETQAFVAQMVRLAQAGEFEQLCRMGGGNCEQILATGGAENVPVDPPTVARIYVVPSVRHADGSWSQGGQMVEMCGSGRSGASYQTQMIVFRDRQQGVMAIEPIYWSGFTISVNPEQPVAPRTSPAFAC